MSIITDFNIDDIKQSDLLKGFDFNQYTEEDHERWKTLIDGVLQAQGGIACSSYQKGMDMLGENFSDLPNLEELNNKLERYTGWKVMPVNGLLPCEDFYHLLSQRVFPSATFVRDWHSQAFTGYPDIFHDVVGHIPLFFDKEFSNFLQRSSSLIYKILSNAPNGSAIKERMILNFSRYGWFTWEAGMIKEDGWPKAYGGAILSSSGETAHVQKRGITDFNLLEVFNTPYTDKEFSSKYFVIDSYKDLYGTLELIKSVYDVEGSVYA
jgi:phenylalanine-4-hydroxylase